MTRKKIIFVYNADSGFFNTVADIAHKISSPETYQCKLCALTHGYFSIRDQWDKHLKQSGGDFVFYHKDEFEKKYPNNTFEFPAVFSETRGSLELVINKQRIEKLKNLDELIELINQL